MNWTQIARLAGVATIAAVVSITGSGARAQTSLPASAGGQINPGAPVIGGAKPGAAKLKPPPALPGSRIQKDEPAPAERPAAEMVPTDALFDAINRGDMAGVRDAMSRGADLGGRNVLGLTPIDLSVDLGRNDITFLLMSLRGAVPSSGPPANAAAAALTQKPAGKTKLPAQQVAAAHRGLPPAPNPQERFVPVRQASESVVGSLDAGPGTPVPQAGFLGFGAPRTTAQP